MLAKKSTKIIQIIAYFKHSIFQKCHIYTSLSFTQILYHWLIFVLFDIWRLWPPLGNNLVLNVTLLIAKSFFSFRVYDFRKLHHKSFTPFPFFKKCCKKECCKTYYHFDENLFFLYESLIQILLTIRLQ